MNGLNAGRKLPSDSTSRYLAIIAAGFTLVAIYGSLVPLQYRPLDWNESVEQFRHIPYAQLSEGSRTDWVTNILLFVPIGYFWLGSLAQGRSWFGTALGAIVLMPVLAFLSVAIEFAQIWFPPRVPALNDIVAESVGAAVGEMAWLITGRHAVIWVKQYSNAHLAGTQIQWLLQAYLVGFVIYSLLPLDLTINVSELFRKARDGRILVVPFVYTYGSTWSAVIQTVRDILLAIPIGYLCAISGQSNTDSPRGLAAAWLIGLAIVAAIELAQVFVYSRVADITDAVVGSLGVSFGIALVYRLQGAKLTIAESSSRLSQLRHSIGWSVVAVIYAVVLVAVLWAPYDFLRGGEEVRQRFHTALERVPGDTLHAGMPFNAVVQMLARLVVYAPLGAIVVFWSRAMCDSKTGRWIALGIGFIASGALATLIELGQVLLPARVADFSEVPMCLAGSALGIAIMWRLLSATGEVRESTTLRPLVSPDHLSTIPTPRGDRVRGMDGLRAIACLAVFAVHLQKLTGTSGKWGALNWNFLLENGRVALFFMLSGALLSISLWKTDFAGLSKRWLSRYVAHRLLRITPAYFACLLAIILWKRHWQGGGEILDSLLHIGLVHNYRESAFYSLAPPFWTIAVQAQFYVLLPFILWLLTWRACAAVGRGWILIVLAIGSYAAHCCVMESLPIEQRSVVYTHSVLAHLPHLLLGVFVGQFLANVKPTSDLHSTQRRWLCDGLVVAIAAAMVAVTSASLDASFRVPHGRYNFPYVPLLIAVGIAAVPRSNLVLRLLESQPLRFLGMISFGVYVYHYSLMQLTAKIIRRLGATPEENWFAFAAVSLVLTLMVATVSYYLLELPLFHWFSQESKSGRHTESDGVTAQSGLARRGWICCNERGTIGTD